MEIIGRYRVIIACTMIGAVVLGIFWYAFILSERVGKTAFTLTVMPPETKIKMNNVAVTSGTYYLLPGKYTVVAQAEGFLDYRKVIQVGQEAVALPVPLVPVTDKARKWVKDNQALYQGVLDASNNKEAQETALLKQKNPITDRLPYQAMLFAINYKADTSDATHSRIILQVTAGEGYRRSVFQKIREWGYDPTDFKIEYIDYKSPFAS